MNRFLYRLNEAEKEIPCNRQELRELVRSGRLEARQLGRRVYITADSIEDYIDSLPRVEILPETDKGASRKRLPQSKAKSAAASAASIEPDSDTEGGAQPPERQAKQQPATQHP